LNEQIFKIHNWLTSFEYKLAIERKTDIKDNVFYNEQNMKEHTIAFKIDENDIDEKLLKSVSFCIADENYINIARRLNVPAYTFDNSKNSTLSKTILLNHENIRFALSYNFPTFRVAHSDIVINQTAFQNASWAIVTASPNFVPGPHQVVATPIEAISDFAVLTANEVKLLFELVGLSGMYVNPLTCLMEFGIILGFAKLAEVAATNIVGKVPAGAGLVIKGAIAYAFTYAIGEAIFFYLSTGEKLGKEFFNERIKHYYEEGKKIATEIFKKKKNEDNVN